MTAGCYRHASPCCHGSCKLVVLKPVARMSHMSTGGVIAGRFHRNWWSGMVITALNMPKCDQMCPSTERQERFHSWSGQLDPGETGRSSCALGSCAIPGIPLHTCACLPLHIDLHISFFFDRDSKSNLNVSATNHSDRTKRTFLREFNLWKNC